MDQPPPADRGPDDVLSIGEGRSPRWGAWLAVLAVVLLGIGGYRIASGPSTPASPPSAAAAEDSDAFDELENERDNLPSAGGFESSEAVTSVRLGRTRVVLTGPGIQVPHREASATALGRLRNGWLVELTSTACEDRTDVRVSYGVARASGRFTPWTRHDNARRPVWRSPDRSPDRRLVLVEQRRRLEVRRAATGKVMETFRTPR